MIRFLLSNVALRRLLSKKELFVFATTLAIFVLTVNTLWTGDHANSILQLQYAMFSSHSFVLGKMGEFHSTSIDTFTYKGYWYSAIAPGVALLSFPFGSLGFFLDGYFTPFGMASLFDELFLAVANALAAMFVYKLARLYFRQNTSIIVAFAYAFSTISWPFATMLFQHDLSAALDVIAAFCFLTYFKNGEKRRDLRLAFGGLALGLAFVVDYINVALIPIFVGYALYSIRKNPEFKSLRLRILMTVLGTIGIGIAIIGTYNFVTFGNVLFFSEQTYLATRGGLLGNFSTPLYLGLVVLLLSPYRGLVLYCPFVIIGVLGTIKVVRNKQRSFDLAKRVDTVFFGLIALGTVLPYSAWYDVLGGESFGPRFLIAAIPFILLPSGFLIESAAGRRLAFGAFSLYAFGAIINAAASMNNALGCNGNYWTYVPFECSIPNLMVGDLDGWWRSLPEYYWIPICLGVIAITLILPLPSFRKLNQERESTDQLQSEGRLSALE